MNMKEVIMKYWLNLELIKLNILYFVLCLMFEGGI